MAGTAKVSARAGGRGAGVAGTIVNMKARWRQ